MIDRTEFLDVIFGEIEDGENVCVSEGKPKEGGGMWFANHLEGDRVWRLWEPEKTRARGTTTAARSMVG